MSDISQPIPGSVAPSVSESVNMGSEAAKPDASLNNNNVQAKDSAPKQTFTFGNGWSATASLLNDPELKNARASLNARYQASLNNSLSSSNPDSYQTYLAKWQYNCDIFKGPFSMVFDDATLTYQNMDWGYHLEYNPNGILWRVSAAGIPHPDDYNNYLEQNRIIEAATNRTIAEITGGRPRPGIELASRDHGGRDALYVQPGEGGGPSRDEGRAPNNDERKNAAIEKAINISSSYEGRAGFRNIAGNFDGQGLSLGYNQWNIGKGTLQPLLEKYFAQNPAAAQQLFGTDYQTMVGILNSSLSSQLDWAISINDASGKNILPDWANKFKALCDTPEFRKIQLDAGKEDVKEAIKVFKELTGYVKTERSFALIYDIQVNNGGLDKNDLMEIKKKIAPGTDEKEVQKFIAELVIRQCNPDWQADNRLRKYTIIEGQGTIHGEERDLAKEYGLSDEAVSF